MQKSHQPIWQLSQGHLNLLESCPRKFQHRYLDRLDTSVGIDTHPHQQLGSQFHQLMQQRSLGLSIEPLLATDERLQAWFDAFRQYPPEMIEGVRDSEHQRIHWQDGFMLVAIYDLLIQNSDQAQIVDWKTYPLPKQSDRLRTHWQTQLYLYVLAETSEYAPEQLSMTYWFAEAPAHADGHPNFLTFPYSKAQHEKNQQSLTTLLTRLRQELTDYETGEAMPQVALSDGQCVSPKHQCEFAERCQRRLDEEAEIALQETLADIDAIPEVPLTEEA